MFKLLSLLILSLNTICNSINCYTAKNVLEQGFTSYNNKVYDIKNYQHPGGQRTLLLSKGKPLEGFFNMNEYSFHVNSINVKRDLENIYIGDLYMSCGNQTLPAVVNNIILNNSHLLFSAISFSVFGILLLSTIIINNTNIGVLFNKNINICNVLFLNIGHFIFLLVYFLWWISLLILSFFSNEILTRLGIFISLNICFSMLPMTRNSIWVILLKIRYNNLILLHKSIAILTVISTIIKIIVAFLQYKNDLVFLSNISNIMGILCAGFIILIFVTSLHIVKNKIFEVFYYFHRITSILIIITMVFHYISSLYYILPSILLYISDLVIRLINIKKPIYTKISKYEISEFNTSYIFLNIKFSKEINTKPGCYFFICCRDISSYEWHPVSLIQNKNNTFEFCIKDMGEKTWSNKLKNFKKNTDIYLQGPYLNFKMEHIREYKYVLCISNGIGITPFFSIISKLKNLVNVKSNLVWIIPNETFIIPFKDKLNNLNSESTTTNVYVTRPSKIIEENLKFSITPNKPILKEYIYNFIDNYVQNKKDICILTCGSESLIYDINKICYELNITTFNEKF